MDKTDIKRLQYRILNEKVSAIMDFLVVVGASINDNQVGGYLATAFQALDHVKRLTAAPVFRIHLTNFDYYRPEEFYDSESAVEFGRKMGFEITINEFRNGEFQRLICSYSPLSGVRYFV